METLDKKNILNPIYQSLLLATTSVGYAYLLKKNFKTRICDPSSPDIQEILKLGGVVAVSNMTLDYLYDMNVISLILGLATREPKPNTQKVQ
jgi:hypothetical protein